MLLTLICSGCWEEIRYEPSQTPLAQPSTPPSAVEEVDEEELAVPAVESAALIEDTLPVEPYFVAEQPVQPAESSLASQQPEGPALPQSALATWRMASKWSYAVALAAKGRSPDRYAEHLEPARYAAKLVEIDLAELPQDVSADQREKELLAFLTEDSGPKLSRQLLDRYDAQHAALANLAIQTHALLLTYTPRNPRVAEFLPAVRQAPLHS